MDALLSVPRTDETPRVAIANADRVCRPLMVSLAEHIAAKGGRAADTLSIAGFLKGARAGESMIAPAVTPELHRYGSPKPQ